MSALKSFINLISIIGFILVLNSSCKKPLPPQPAPLILDAQCYDAYAQFYSKPIVKFLVVYGYKDARPARFVADRYERANFVQALLKPCLSPTNSMTQVSGSASPDGLLFACGFQRDTQDMDLFEKTMEGPSGAIKTFRLQVVSSSVSADDEWNRTNPFQKWQSKYAKTLFLSGLKSEDGVFYDGHSRAGGGPDFSPAQLRSNQHVAYDWYKRNPVGTREMNRELTQKESHIKLLGLFSCASQGLFSQKITKSNPKLALITSERLLYFADAQLSMLKVFDALLGMKCQIEFREIINHNSDQVGTQLRGFF